MRKKTKKLTFQLFHQKYQLWIMHEITHIILIYQNEWTTFGGYVM